MPDDADREKHRATVRASFDKQAVDFSNSPVMTDRGALDRLVAWTAVGGGERVLDVACGPGLVAAALAPHVTTVVGVDVTPAMLARAAAVVCERGVTNAAFAQADVERLPFPDRCFDRVVSRRAFHHFPDPAPVLGEMARVCAANGAIVIEDQAPPPDPAAADVMTMIDRLRDPSHTRAVDPDTWATLFAGAGLAIDALAFAERALDFDEWITRAHPTPTDAAGARAMLEAAARGEIPGLQAWHAGTALRFLIAFQLVRGVRSGGRPEPRQWPAKAS